MYDARGSAPGGTSGNMAFAGAAILVVVLCFIAALFIPDLFGTASSSSRSARNDPQLARLAVLLPDKRVQRTVELMGEVDPQGRAMFMMGIERGDTAEQLTVSLTEWSQDFFEENALLLARIDMKYVDREIELVMGALQSLKSQRSQFCLASTYEKYQRMGAEQAQREALVMLTMGMQPGAPLYEFVVESNLIMVEAMAEAKTRPVEYGQMTRDDERRVSGAMRSMMMSPEVMGLMAASSRGGKADTSRINVCDLAARAVKTFDDLPRDTKGRMWYTAITQQGGLPGF